LSAAIALAAASDMALAIIATINFFILFFPSEVMPQSHLREQSDA
jgi:hypothetical protein